MFFWIILFLFTNNLLGESYGFPYLFLSPEFQGQVSFWSFAILGITSGLFVMAFHISSYIYYSYRFPFLATLNRPLYKFCLNNSIIPLIFFTAYYVSIIMFLSSEGYGFSEIALNLFGLLLGLFLTVSFSFTYFFGTIRSLELPNKEGKERNPLKPLNVLIKKEKDVNSAQLESQPKVTHYLKGLFTIKLARDASHYNKKKLASVIQEHHFSASIYFVILILLVGALNFGEIHIPAGASIFIIFSLYLMITGAIYTRLKTWTLTVGIIAIFIFNQLSGLEPFKNFNYAFGLDYSKEFASYNYQELDKITSDSIQKLDLEMAIQSLENWKAKFPKDSKPQLIVINVSGGGLRSSLWTTKVLQELDENCFDGQLMKKAHLITGSSGGMLGAAFYRELRYLKGYKGRVGKEDLRSIGQDALNPVANTLAVHDLLFRFRKIKYQNKEYLKDRGYAFDQKINKNTNGILDYSLGRYKTLEFNSELPTLLLSPTIVGDGRRLLMSTQGLSYLGVQPSYWLNSESKNYDGVEYARLFKNQSPMDISFLTALRLTASFPYITPLVNLPSKPPMELIDAGVRDNDGLELALRYIHKCKGWIDSNTSGVVIIQIKANRPDEIAINESNQSRIDQLTLPINGVVQSFNNMQIYNKAILTNWSNQLLDFPVEILRFSLADKTDDLSLSWHLTESEKLEILSAFESARNQAELKSLLSIIEAKK